MKYLLGIDFGGGASKATLIDINGNIIAENTEYIIFVEVKTRGENALYTPKEAVDERKQKRLSLAAMKYLSKTESSKMTQFDVFEVYSANGRIYKFNRIENAFEGYDFGGRYDIF